MKVSFYTIGCRLNQAETAILQQSFAQTGHEVVDFKQPADVVIVNTCTVTARGDADTRKIVNRICKDNPSARIALVGCQAQTQKERLLELPNVQWVVGNAVKMDLHLLLTESLNAEPQVMVPDIRRQAFTIPAAGIDRKHTRANLKIQDGCDFFCTFCEIPYARGRARSRVFDDILAEARILADAGHKEVVLTGINIGTFKYENKRLLNVIEALEKIDGIERIRISSIEGKTISDELLHHMANSKKLCRHLHISLQSGSNTILKAMKRRYTVEAFSEFLNKAEEQVPNICLGTDVLVGFPGETDELFEETMQNVKNMPLAYFHVFSYSDRENNRSRHFADKVDKHSKDERSTKLRELGARHHRLYLEKQIGNMEKVLFETRKDDGWTGLTDTYVRVRVAADADLKNTMRHVRLESISGQQMIGTLID